MNWKRIFNPWAALREADTTIAILQDRLDDARARADDAEDKAFHRASDHYWQRNRMIEAQLEYTQKQMTTIASLTPIPPFIDQTKGE